MSPSACSRTLPGDFRRWSFLAQDQYLETRTLLPGYLLSSQGDRMLMAHSVEGRFPFLDRRRGGRSPMPFRPPTSSAGWTRSTCLKRVATGLVPDEIIRRPKQPYRAPDAACFVGAGAPDWVAEALSERAVAQAGVFEPSTVGRLWRKCRSNATGEPLSNTDNMALVGVLSTALLFEQLVRRAPERSRTIEFQTVVDRWPGHDADRPLARGSREMMST